MNILDCTLRDGGYYNNWDFNEGIVAAYLDSVASAGISHVELGFRNFAMDGFFGAYAFTTESHLSSLELPPGPEYGVMVDAKTILNSQLSIDDAIDSIFVSASESKLSFVRIAAHFKEVARSEQIAQKLKSMGYTVGFNLMQSGGKSESSIEETAACIQSWESVDVLYFADSLGNMDALEVVRIIRSIRVSWNGELGIHTHNNMGKGLDNTMTARENGVTWLDSTITGMGRGAGNTPTEYLLAVLSDDQSGDSYDPKPVYGLVIRHFAEMQKKFGWGSNLLYFLGAQNGVHPTYIQNLLADTHYGPDEIVGALDYLSTLEGTESYSTDVLKTALNINADSEAVSGSDELKNKFRGREVLIVNNGPGLSKYLPAIKGYIKRSRPIVLCVNILGEIDEGCVDFYCVSHNNKFLSERQKYSCVDKPIVLPKHRFKAEELEYLPEKCVDYGISVSPGSFNIKDWSCELPYDLTLAYALAVSINGGAERISLVGVDGYESTDPRQLEMIRMLNIVRASFGDTVISALTPTSYPIQQRSIYAPTV